jgi:Putative prokaryotic signal transducing protein
MAEPSESSTASQQPDPNEKLVKVFDSEDESEVLVVKGLLDSAGIDNDMTAASMIQDMFPGLGGMIILVRDEEAEAARQLITDYKQAPAEDDETAEIEISEEPPSKA